MTPQADAAARDTVKDYSRLLISLAGRAQRLGSRDPEAAAQEALRRSLENEISRDAVEYYFADAPPDTEAAPVWPLDRLFAWLHAVLQFVVREERARSAYRNEIHGAHADPVDPAPDTLNHLIRQEMDGIVRQCFPSLDPEYRGVLTMRVEGMKYGEIAHRMGVTENTVATWVSRGIRELGRLVRRATLPGGVQ